MWIFVQSQWLGHWIQCKTIVQLSKSILNTRLLSSEWLHIHLQLLGNFNPNVVSWFGKLLRGVDSYKHCKNDVRYIKCEGLLRKSGSPDIDDRNIVWAFSGRAGGQETFQLVFVNQNQGKATKSCYWLSKTSQTGL